LSDRATGQVRVERVLPDARIPVQVPAPERTARAAPAAPAVPHTKVPVAIFDNFWATTLSFITSLGSRGVPLHIYGSGAGRWSRYATSQSACPPVEHSEEFLPWLRARVRSGEIRRVAPTTDLIAYYLSVIREEFAPEVRRTIAPLEELESCLIKTRFSAACVRAGQPTPAIVCDDEPEAAIEAGQQLGFPLMMKPNSHLGVGSGERGQIIRDLSELRAAYRPYAIAPGQESLAARYPELRWPLLQKFIPSARSRVFSISGIKDSSGGIVAASLSCKRRQWPPDVGISTSQITCNDARILATGLKTVNRLLSRGLFELELLVSGPELLAIDLNPRAFGFIALDIALGNDLPWLWFRATQRPLEPRPIPETRPIMESRLLIPYSINRVVGALLSARRGKAAEEETHPAAEASVSMLGNWSDPLPMLLSNLSLLRHPGSLLRPYVRAAMRSRRSPGL